MRFKNVSVVVGLCVLMLGGCTTSKMYVSQQALSAGMEQVEVELAQQGFRLEGRSSEFGYKIVDTYRFSDADGAGVNYSISYDRESGYVENVHVERCETTKDAVKDFDRYCGSQSAIARLETLQPDYKAEELDAGMTLTAIYGVSLGLPLLVLLCLLL